MRLFHELLYRNTRASGCFRTSSHCSAKNEHIYSAETTGTRSVFNQAYGTCS